jgi:hypothetical protein
MKTGMNDFKLLLSIHPLYFLLMETIFKKSLLAGKKYLKQYFNARHNGEHIYYVK